MKRVLLMLALAAFLFRGYGRDVGVVLGRCEIVRAAGLSAVDRFVLDDVKALLARAVGHEIPEIVADGSRPPDASGRLCFGIAPAGFDRSAFSSQERCVAVTNGSVYVFGGGVNGNRYAAYDFLQNTLGFGFYDARGGIGVPDLSGRILTNGVRRSAFAFQLRQISSRCRYNGREAALFLFRQGVNDSYSVELMKAEGLPASLEPDFRTPWPSDAGMPCYLPPNPQARRTVSRRVSARCGELEKTHPEYFTLNEKGVRVFDHQRCLSNRGCRDLIVGNFLEHIGGFRQPTIFDFSANDTGGRFCWCDACRRLEDAYGSPGGPLFDSVLELSGKVAEHHPGHAVLMLAYRKDQTQHPPTNGARFASNVIVQFAPIDDNFARDWRDPSNAASYEDLKRWCRLVDRVWTWYYPNPYGPAPEAVPPPVGNLERVAEDIRLMKAAGVTGVHFEHNVGVAPMTGFTELQSYVMLRMLDDVTLDEHRLARDFLDFEYGPAAKDVAGYLSELEQIRKTQVSYLRWTLPYPDYGYFTKDRLSRWEALFDAMAAKTSGLSEVSRRLRRLRLGLDLVCLRELNEAQTAVKVRIAETVGEIGRDCYSDRHQDAYRAFREKVEELVFLNDVKSEAQAKPLPSDLFGGIPSANLFVTIPKVNRRPYVEDEDAAFGKAAVVDDLSKIPFPIKTGLDRPGEGGDLPGIGLVGKRQLGPRGRYAFYEVGRATLTRKAILYVGSWLAFRANVGSAYEEGAFNKARFYASLKFEGPAFYKEDEGRPNRVFCDRIVVVRDWERAEGSEVRADAFGFDPADATASLRRAICSGARRVVIPKKESPWFVTPLSFSELNDVEIVFEDGAEVCAKRGAYKGLGDRLLAFQYCRGLTLRGKGRLRMWKDDYPDQGGHRHALAIHCCRDVRVEGLEIVESGGDGIYVSTGKPRGAFKSYSENVVIRDVRCLRNFRQGISIIAVDGLLVENCELSDTCGTSPQAGIDFEPNNPRDAIRRCVMRNCLLERNKGFGIDTLFTHHDETTPPLDITIENCTSRDNQKAIHFNGIAQNGNFRSNAGRIVVKDCVFRETGGKDEPVSREVTWGGALSRPEAAGLRPFTADDWREETAVVTDLRPGERVALSPVRFRRVAEYVIYAAAPGEVSFEGRQVLVGAKSVPSQVPLVLSLFRGGKVAEIPAPATTDGVLRATVPAKGFYRLSWACGWGSSLVLAKSSVPIAFSMFPQRDELYRWLAPFLYGCDPATFYLSVPEGAPRFAAVACGIGGGLGESARMILKDPSGRVVADIDNVRTTDACFSAPQPPAGLWTLTATRPSARPLNNFGVDVAGLPPLFFLSREKYWTSR